MRNDFDQALLEEASSALEAACKLLDRKFGSGRWRAEWSMGDIADKIRREAFGYESFEAAEAEAAARRPVDGNAWGARFDAAGRPVVVLDE